MRAVSSLSRRGLPGTKGFRDIHGGAGVRFVKIGFDYWQVISHYPAYFQALIEALVKQGHEVHVISAVGDRRSGTVEEAVAEKVSGVTAVHEVIWDDPADSPALKAAKCLELGIEAFYDDREDVCLELHRHGIVAMRVIRMEDGATDISAERT